METLTLPTGEEVTPDDVFLFGGYPYRFVPRTEGFVLSPLYWGGGDMDIPFRNRQALVDQWGEDGEASGPQSAEAWKAWLRDARDNDAFGERELDALAVELGVAEPADEVDGESDGLLARVRRLFT